MVVIYIAIIVFSFARAIQRTRAFLRHIHDDTPWRHHFLWKVQAGRLAGELAMNCAPMIMVAFMIFGRFDIGLYAAAAVGVPGLVAFLVCYLIEIGPDNPHARR